MQDKQSVRKKLLETRASYPVNLIREKSGLIQQRVAALSPFKMAHTIALYYPIRGEVETWELFRIALSEGKEIFFPRIEGRNLQFISVKNKSSFQFDSLGIPQPTGGQKATDRLGCIIVPGVGFDREGHRLGFGQGYYDRSLQAVQGYKMGIAYDFQLTESLPHDERDLRCDWVVSESQIIRRAYD